MSLSSGSASPDPITLPSSPLGARSGNARPLRRTSTKPSALRSSMVAPRSSPSKSFIMDTGLAGDASPWRIKVTVEAEPRDGSSPSKKTTRTSKVPLKGTGSSSPAKKRSARSSTANGYETDEGTSDAKRPQRKRKGTPIRRRATRVQTEQDEPGTDAGEGDAAAPHSPSKQTAPRRGSTGYSYRTERSRRLDQARADRDTALQDALGHGEEAGHEHDVQENFDPDSPIMDYAGEMTMANEDFTMVSVETLQSMKQNTSQLLDHSGLDMGEKSVASVSYMPSSPPMSDHSGGSNVHYPDVATQISAAKEQSMIRSSFVERTSQSSSRQYDAMSWKYTTSQTSAHGTPNVPMREETSQLHRSSNQAATLTGTTAERAIVIEDSTVAGAEDSSDEAEGAEADIWAEEASRSLEESQEESDASHFRQLLGDEPHKPPRAKIPRTWRRTSGIEFSYADSPDFGALRKVSAASTDGEGIESRSDGVLTPPGTDDEEVVSKPLNVDELEESDISFTQPDAAATPLPVQRITQRPTQARALSNRSDSSDSATSPDGEGDSGMFWQKNLPNLNQKPTRPKFQRRQPAMNLSELLNLHNAPSPAKERPSIEPSEDAISTRPFAGRDAVQKVTKIGNSMALAPTRSAEKVMSSPLRLSLLKSSKIGGSVLLGNSQFHGSANESRALEQRVVKQVDLSALSESRSGLESTLNSFESHASDQRQLLDEMQRASSGSGSLPEQDGEDSLHSSEASGYSEHEQTLSGYQLQVEAQEQSELQNEESEMSVEYGEDPTRSYEEHLNLDSPRKILVKFNDSNGNSSLLKPKKQYPPIFCDGNAAAPTFEKEQAMQPPASASLFSKKVENGQNQPASGIFSRLSTTLWSAIVRPSGPAEILPEEQPPEPVYCHFLRRDIRSRYGVLSDQHPWTLAHMRTLHRLLNSCTSGKSDSFVPKSGPLPLGLERLVDKEVECVIPGLFSWIFTEQHGHVVDAFMQTLVPEHIAQAMKDGEMEFLGDKDAKIHRGMFGKRHGDEALFQEVPEYEPQGMIERDFVVKALGHCILANMETAAKLAAKAEEESG